jgi:hypothetical protein
LLEENAAEHQRLLTEFEAAPGRSQTSWSEQAKELAKQSLNAGLRAARDSTALLLEEAARMNGAAVRKAFEEGASREHPGKVPGFALLGQIEPRQRTNLALGRWLRVSHGRQILNHTGRVD